MAVQHDQTLSVADARTVAGQLLKDAQGPALAIVEAKDLDRDLLKSNPRARVVSTNNLIGVAGLPGESLLTMAGLDRNRRLRDTADRAVLHARVLMHLSNEGKSRFTHPHTVAKGFRDVLAEMKTHLPADKDLKQVVEKCMEDHKEHQAELATVVGLWDTLCADDRKKREKSLADCAQGLDTVVYLGWEQRVPVLLQGFLAAARENATTKVQHIHLELEGQPKTLDDLWNRDQEGPGTQPEPVNLTMCQAGTLERAAQEAYAKLVDWLNPGKKKKIGVCCHDRVLFRRLDSLCRQHGLLINDQAMWKASNLLAGDVLLGRLASPRTEAERHAAQLRLLHLHARSNEKGIDAGLVRKVVRGDHDNDVNKLLDALDPGKGSMTPADWFGVLNERLDNPQMSAYLDSDLLVAERLRSLLALLERGFAADMGEDNARLSIANMRSILHDAMANTNITTNIVRDSPVISFMPGRFSGDNFDAVLLLGANNKTLPAESRSTLLPKAVRKELGLPTDEDKVAEMRKSTAMMVGGCEEVAAIWHGEAGPSPYLEILPVPAGKTTKDRMVKPMQPPWERKRSQNTINERKVDCQGMVGALHRQATRKKRRDKKIDEQVVPTISTSQLDTLMKCPYQFYAKNILGLREDEQRELYNSGIFGSFVHAILKKYHEQIKEKSLQKPDLTVLENMLKDATDTHVQETLAKGDANKQRINLMRQVWLPYINPYAMVMKEHLSVWKIKEVEKYYDKDIRLNEKLVKFVGTVDRVDQRSGNGNGDNSELAVIDIKTGTFTDKQVKEGERPQLSVYVKLVEENEGAESVGKNSALWQLKSPQGKHQVRIPKPYSGYRPDEIYDHVEEIFKSMVVKDDNDRVLVPANGEKKTCEYCAYEGLCRRSHWDAS